LTFITDRNFPGGPDAFVIQEYGMFVNIFGTVAYVVLNYFADGLVVSNIGFGARFFCRSITN